MTEYDKDAQKLLKKIQCLFAEFEKKSSHHQRDESFLSVDSTKYTVTAKVRSPFGNGQSHEEIVSTNELQQRINYWLGLQRELGRAVSIRLIITPDIETVE